MNHSQANSRARLLQLPLELRQDIYSHLCPPNPISHPISSVGITSVSHHPPPISFLLTNRALHDDVQEYYHSVASWKLIASHAFNFYRIDPTLANFATLSLLQHLQKVELVFWFDAMLLKNYPSLKQQTYCDEVKKRATRACEILSTAPKLHTVFISWVDTVIDSDLEDRKSVLEALIKLGNNVKVEIGSLESLSAHFSPQREQFEERFKCLVETIR
jgi:hypothetical protein